MSVEEGEIEMIELEFLGRSGDASSVIFTDEEGERYIVTVTDELRAALRRDLSLTAGGSTNSASTTLRPRDIQALLREGYTAKEIAERQGIEIGSVSKYEAPIVAERIWAIQQARQSRIRADSGSPILDDLVINRLASRGVNHQSLAWSALKRPGKDWEVSLTFVQGAVEQSATWILATDGTKVEALDQEAQWLTETASPIAPVSAFLPPPANDVDLQEQQLQESLIDQANTQRGKRQPVLEEYEGDVAPATDPADIEGEDQPFFSARVLSFETAAPPTPLEVPMPLELPVRRHSILENRTDAEETRIIELVDPPAQRESLFEVPAEDIITEEPAKKKRPQRRSVPSWDEIVFGARPE